MGCNKPILFLFDPNAIGNQMHKFFFLSVATAFTCAAPLTAQAQDLFSGELELGISRNSSKDTFFKRVEGSFASNFDGWFDFQIDLGMSKYEAVNSTSPFLALHLMWQPSDKVDLGLFISGEDRLGTSYTIEGLEMAYESGPFRVEGYVAVQDPILAGPHGELAGLDLSYAFGSTDQWSLTGGGHYADLGTTTADTVYLGLARRFGDDFEVEARVAQNDGAYTVVTVGARFILGDGVRFNRRDWYAAFPAY